MPTVTYDKESSGAAFNVKGNFNFQSSSILEAAAQLSDSEYGQTKLAAIDIRITQTNAVNETVPVIKIVTLKLLLWIPCGYLAMAPSAGSPDSTTATAWLAMSRDLPADSGRETPRTGARRKR